MPRRTPQIILAALVLAGGALFTASIDVDPPGPDLIETPLPPLQDATFIVTATTRVLDVRGTTASGDHEAALQQLAQDHFGDREARFDFKPGVVLPANWDTMTSRLLYALAATESANATIENRKITIRAVSTDKGALVDRLDFLREALGDGVELSVSVVDAVIDDSFEDLCQRAAGELVLGPVSFRQASTELRDAAYVTLDRLADYANDCPASIIAITGHTDASGDEAWNRQLSLQRARIVADHLIAQGVDPERLLVDGRGSDEPIADNATALGRERNRRIEFELR